MPWKDLFTVPPFFVVDGATATVASASVLRLALKAFVTAPFIVMPGLAIPDMPGYFGGAVALLTGFLKSVPALKPRKLLLLRRAMPGALGMFFGVRPVVRSSSSSSGISIGCRPSLKSSLGSVAQIMLSTTKSAPAAKSLKGLLLGVNFTVPPNSFLSLPIVASAPNFFAEVVALAASLLLSCAFLNFVVLVSVGSKNFFGPPRPPPIDDFVVAGFSLVELASGFPEAAIVFKRGL